MRILLLLLTLPVIGCGTIFRSPSSYERIGIRVPVNAVVVDVGSGDTLAVNTSDTLGALRVPVDAYRVTVLRISTDTNITWKVWKPEFHGLAMLNYFNIGIGFVIDQLTGASATPEIIDRYSIATSNVAPSVISELDEKYESQAGICGPSSVIDDTRRTWLIVAAARIGGMGPATEAVFFYNTLHASIGVRPLHFFEVSYDYTSSSYLGLGDIEDASVGIHGVGLLLREPHTGLFVRGTYGTAHVAGLASKNDPETLQYIAGSVKCWSWGAGYSGDWATLEYRQFIVPPGQTISGYEASGKLFSFSFGVNVFF
ncbi:MAG: hypothetical protein IPG73_13420 [Ignavibacteria bacterium]|nr:hypothetical protein [Ignavibacteria bacterium]